jgi:hypothetical protein
MLLVASVAPPGQPNALKGDRYPDVDVSLQYPQDCYIHNGQGGRVIDVTNLPTYMSDHDAHRDGTHPDETTDALLDTYDWVVNELKNAGGSSWNHHKVAYIIYLPDGTYSVNRQIIHRGNPWLRSNGHENLHGIRFYGQSREKTIIKLVDGADGFQSKNAPRAVLAFTKHTRNNSISLNGLQNLTINTGSGNAGAIGVDFQGANMCFIRNIMVKSDDGDGYAGVRYPIWPTQGFHTDITVEGFDHGIDVVGGMVANGPAFENITLKNQNRAGFRVQTTVTPVRNLYVVNPKGPAVKLTTSKGHLVLLDSRFENGPASNAVIEAPADCQSLLCRNIEIISGFGNQCIQIGSNITHSGSLSGEYVADPTKTLFGDQRRATLNLPIEASPVVPYDPPPKWVSVESKGATGDDSSDDTEAIQAAMNACDGVNQTTVYFRGSGEFHISRSIDVPAGVKRVIFMWGGRIDTRNLGSRNGVLRVSEASADPLIIEDYFQHVNGNTGYFVDHAGTRTVVCRNVRGSRDFSNYKHSSGHKETKLFLENVCHMLSEGCQFDNTCWARWVNTETADSVEFLNSGGKLWVLGYKCEDEAINFRTTAGGYTEVLGGIINQYRALVSKK